MILSKFFHSMQIENNLYAIYNSLVMDVIYLNKKQLNNVKKYNVNKEDMIILQNAGIYVDDPNKDNEALNIVKKRYDKVCGKVNIMYLIMSTSCNLGCKYCFIENCQFNNKKETNMSEETAIQALRKYDSYLKRNKIRGSIIFYGGEPLVNWNVIKKILIKAKAMKSPIDFSMVTNATLLDEEKIKFLASNNVEIGISIDGPKILNDKNRIYRNSEKSVYDEVIKKFPMLKAHKTKFGLSITVSNDFLDNQGEVLDWLLKLNIKSVFYNLYHYTSYDDNWEDYYKRACKFLIKSYERLSKNNIYDGRLIRKVESFYDNEFKFSDCGAIGANQLAIKPNGDVCICHGYLKTDKYVIGNINEISIETIMRSDEIEFWKHRNTLNNKECLKCEALYVCGGGCAIQAEALFGSRSEIDKPFCIHSKSALNWLLKESYRINTMKNKEEEVKK